MGQAYKIKLIFISRSSGKQTVFWIKEESDLQLIQPDSDESNYNNYWQVNGIKNGMDFECNSYHLIKKDEAIFL